MELVAWTLLLTSAQLCLASKIWNLHCTSKDAASTSSLPQRPAVSAVQGRAR